MVKVKELYIEKDYISMQKKLKKLAIEEEKAKA